MGVVQIGSRSQETGGGHLASGGPLAPLYSNGVNDMLHLYCILNFEMNLNLVTTLGPIPCP